LIAIEPPYEAYLAPEYSVLSYLYMVHGVLCENVMIPGTDVETRQVKIYPAPGQVAKRIDLDEVKRMTLDNEVAVIAELQIRKMFTSPRKPVV